MHSGCLKKSLSLAFAILIACIASAHAQQRSTSSGRASAIVPNAVGGPLKLLYVFPGVRDNGGAAGTGVATSIHCTSMTTTTETLNYEIRNFDSSTKANLNLNIGSAQTRTASTHDTVLYAEDLILNTGVVNQGLVIVKGTSNLIVCTAHVLDAAAAVPQGIDLHGIRFNAVTGTQE
jgi:hypothetical protein